MKGVIFNYLEDFLTQNIGEDATDDLISSCQLQTKEPFVGPGTYPDSDLFAIVGAASKKLGAPVPDLVKAFGKFCFPKLGAAFPKFLEGFDHPKPFLMTVDNVIHVEVRKLFKDSILPKFIFVDTKPDQLDLTYQSERKLCGFMEGLLDGTGEHFGVPIQYEKHTCMSQGAAGCQYTLNF